MQIAFSTFSLALKTAWLTFANSYPKISRRKICSSCSSKSKAKIISYRCKLIWHKTLTFGRKTSYLLIVSLITNSQCDAHQVHTESRHSIFSLNLTLHFSAHIYFFHLFPSTAFSRLIYFGISVFIDFRKVNLKNLFQFSLWIFLLWC